MCIGTWLIYVKKIEGGRRKTWESLLLFSIYKSIYLFKLRDQNFQRGRDLK